jgi:hypothetical protein
MAKRICDPTSGKIGSQVYGIGRNGQFVRTRVVPANPNTTHQQTVRGNFTLASQGWDALTQEQQLAWIAAANNYQTRKVLGMSGPMTGNQLFVRINANLLEVGAAQVDVPPATPQIPAVAPANLVISNTAGVIAVRLTCPTDPGENCVVRGSAPVKNGVHVNPGTVTLGLCPAPAQGSSNITGLYTARYGVPTVGTKLFVEVYNTVNGFDGPRSTFSAVVPAAS